MVYLSDRDNELITTYPLPIAHEYSELLEIDEFNWQARNVQMQQVIEFTIRYCTIIILSEYTRWSADQPHSPTDKFIIQNISKRDLTTCVEILKRVAKDLEREGKTLVPELGQFCISDEGTITEGLYLMDRLADLGEQIRLTRASEDRRHRELFQKHIDLLNRLLDKLDFLKKYRLVRVIETVNQNNDIWSVNEFMGNEGSTKKTLEIQVKHPVEPMVLGLWEPESKAFLALSPYALFCYCNECSRQDQFRDNDFFLFEHQDAGKSIYVGLENTDGISHRITLDEFIDDLMNRQRRLDKPLQTWEDLTEAMRSRTADQLYRLQEKYDSNIYAHRETIESNYRGFLPSEWTGFLVVGDSGAGKTNLLCDLAKYSAQQKDILIFENCAAWDMEATTIRVGPDRFLGGRYRLSLEGSWTRALVRLHQEQPTHTRIVLFLDAINEYIEPRKLLNAIYDHLLVPMSEYHWFKVVIACRSESWRRIGGGFQGERMFFPAIDGSGIAQRLERFNSNELAQAYQLYRRKYNLKTEYAEVGDQVKRFIAYPLMLRLVADSFRGQEIPDTLYSSSVFRKYVEQKIGDPDPALEVISDQEGLIVERIITLMIEQQQDALDKKGLFNDPEIGQLVLENKVGSAYVRLLDKGVFLEVGEEGKTKLVRFTYDQILEYMLAKRLLSNELQIEPVVKLIRESTQFPALWGAVKVKLLMRLKEDLALEEDDFLVQLAYAEDFKNEAGQPDFSVLVQVRGLLKDVLITWSQGSEVARQQVRVFIRQLVSANKESAGLLGVEVANQLGLSDVLEQGAYSRVVSVRQLATLGVFSLFQKGTGQEGIQTFRHIQETVKKQLSLRGFAEVTLRLTQGMDSVQGLRALLDLCILAIPLGYRYPDVVRPVGEMLEELLGRIPGPIKSLLNSILIPFGVETIVAMITSGNQLKKIRPFFRRSQEDPFREKVARLLEYIDPQVGTLDGEMGDLIFELGQEVDMFSYLLIVQALMVRVGPQLDSFYRFCQRLYYQGNDHCRHTALRVFTLMNHIEHGSAYWRPEYREFAEHMVFEMSENMEGILYPLIEERGGSVLMEHWIEEYEDSFSTEPYALWQDRVGVCHIGYIALDELADRSSGALECVQKMRGIPWSQPEWKRTEGIMWGLFNAVTVGIGTMRFNILPILETIKLYFDVQDPKEQEYVVKILLHLRSLYPTEVDTYLADAPNSLRLQVYSKFTQMSLGSITTAGMQWGIPWLYITVPEFRKGFAMVLAESARNSVDVDKDIPQLSKQLLTIPMLEAIAHALATVQKE